MGIARKAVKKLIGKSLSKRISRCIHSWQKAREYKKIEKAFLKPNHPPILIYQMGKVGSTSVYESIKKNELENSVYHVHTLSDELERHIEHQAMRGVRPMSLHHKLGLVLKKILQENPNYPCKIITLVRDPIALFISGLFQNPHNADVDILDENNSIDPVKMTNYLNEKLIELKSYDHIFSWFDKELKIVFNIDVFAKPFDVIKGWSVYEGKRADVLVIRVENLSETGSKVIGDFLGLKHSIEMTRGNVRSEGDDKSVYTAVLKKIKISRDVCKKIYSSRFSKHFYCEDMIEEFISKWSGSKS